MAFEEQQEQLNEALLSLKERIQESSFYNSASESYSALSPKMQKLVLAFGLCLLLLLLLSPAISQYNNSQESLKKLSSYKNTTQHLLQFAKSSKSAQPQPKKFSQNDLQNTLNAFSKSPSIKISPDQNLSVRPSFNAKNPIKSAQIQNFNLQASSLNIKQATALIYSLKKHNKSLFISGLELKSSAKHPGYFDTEIQIGNLSVKPLSEVLPKPELDKPKSRKRKR